MNQNGNNPQNITGYPQQGNYAQGGYPGAYFGQQNGMPNYTAGNSQAAPVQNAGYTPGVAGYRPQQPAEQAGYPRYFNTQSNPNVPSGAGYPPAGNNFGTQIGYPPAGSNPGMQAGYPAGNTSGMQAGYPGGYSVPQQAPYQANPAAQGYPAGSPQYAVPGNGGSYIPQTPYSPGYSTPGYEPPVQNNRYQQGYSAYTQMGREPQNTMPPESFSGQIPLNGGGYVPPPVPVHRRPFELSNPMLIGIGAVLLILFIIAVPVTGSLPLKVLFLALAIGVTALLWIKPLTAENKRLCFTIIAAALCIATVVSFISAGTKTNSDSTKNRASGAGITITDNTGTGKGTNVLDSGVEQPTAEPASTPAPDDENQDIYRVVYEFFDAWGNNKYEDMLKCCAPSWLSKQENTKNALFTILQNRRPTKIQLETITGTSADTSRQVTALVDLDYNTKKAAVKNRINIVVKQENNNWYIEPNSLMSFKPAETEDPNAATETVAPTEPPVDGNTPLYYNPNGGKKYHRDQNCSSANKSILPFQGKFLYSQVNDPDYANLEPCNVCWAPLRPHEEE